MFEVGIVEDRNDPDNMGRYRVRVLGLHSQSQDEVPTKDLPWAMPVMPNTSSSSAGVGDTPRLQVNDWVFVAFLDKLKQVPVIIGSFYGKDDMPNGASTENRVIESESGHRIEINDGEDGYIKITHITGADINIDCDGNVNITRTKMVTMDKDVTIEGDLQVNGDINCSKTVTAETDCVGGGKSLKGHTHTGDGGPSVGTTSAPL